MSTVAGAAASRRERQRGILLKDGRRGRARGVAWRTNLVGEDDSRLSADEQRARADRSARAQLVALVRMLRMPGLTYEAIVIPLRVAFPGIALNLGIAVVDVLVDLIDVANVWLANRKARAAAEAHAKGLAASGADDDANEPHSRRRLVLDGVAVAILHVGRIAYATRASTVPWYVAQLVRCVRVRDLAVHMQRVSDDLSTNSALLAVFKFTLVLFAFPHWLACAWWLISSWGPAGESRAAPAWTGQMEKYGDPDIFDLSRITAPEGYLMSFFMAWAGMSLLGFGQFTIATDAEVVLTIGIALMQIVTYAFVLGTLFHYLVRTDASTAAFKVLLAAVGDYCEKARLPPAMSEQIQDYFLFQHSKQAGGAATVFAQLPLTLKVRVASARFSQHVQQAWFFRSTSAQLLNGVVIALAERFVMPHEVLFNKGDGSRELLWAIKGALHVRNGDAHIATLNAADGRAQLVGEIAFFLGIPQPYTVLATADGEVTLLVLSGALWDEIVAPYPEQAEIILANIHRQFGIDARGRELGEGGGGGVIGGGGGGNGMLGGQIEEEELELLKATIRVAIGERHEDTLAKLMYAAADCDLDAIRLLAAQIDVDEGNYDERTALHIAAAAGKLAAVELLCELGASPDVRDRWGNTPIVEAALHRHDAVASALIAQGAVLELARAADALFDAATAGDTQRIASLLALGVSIDAANHDARTALHHAAAIGQVRVVEYLISRLGDANARDRRNWTPLDDAVHAGHRTVTLMLKRAGAEANEHVLLTAMLQAATTANVDRLRFLQEAGASINASDYDRRTPLHLCVTSGSISTTQFLIFANADVRALDMRENTPLVDALNSSNEAAALLIHYAAAKLPARVAADRILIASYAGARAQDMDATNQKLCYRAQLRVTVNEDVERRQRELGLAFSGLNGALHALCRQQAALNVALSARVADWLVAYSAGAEEDDSSDGSQDLTDAEDGDEDEWSDEGDGGAGGEQRSDHASGTRASPFPGLRRGSGSARGTSPVEPRRRGSGSARGTSPVEPRRRSSGGARGTSPVEPRRRSSGGALGRRRSRTDSLLVPADGAALSAATTEVALAPTLRNEGAPVPAADRGTRVEGAPAAAEERHASTFIQLVLRLPKAERGLMRLDELFKRALPLATLRQLGASERRTAEHDALLALILSLGVPQEQAEVATDEVHTAVFEAVLGAPALRAAMRTVSAADASPSPSASAGGSAVKPAASGARDGGEDEELPIFVQPPLPSTRRRPSVPLDPINLTAAQSERLDMISSMLRRDASRGRRQARAQPVPHGARLSGPSLVLREIYVSEMGPLALFISPTLVSSLAALQPTPREPRASLVSALDDDDMEPGYAEQRNTRMRRLSSKSAVFIARLSTKAHKPLDGLSGGGAGRDELAAAPAEARAAHRAPSPAFARIVDRLGTSPGLSRLASTHRSRRMTDSSEVIDEGGGLGEPVRGVADVLEAASVVRSLHAIFRLQGRDKIRLSDVRHLQGSLGELGAAEASLLLSSLVSAADALTFRSTGGRGGSYDGSRGARAQRSLTPGHFFVGAASWVLATVTDDEGGTGASKAADSDARASAGEETAGAPAAAGAATANGAAAERAAEAGVDANLSTSAATRALSAAIADRIEARKLGAATAADARTLLKIAYHVTAIPTGVRAEQLSAWCAERLDVILAAEPPPPPVTDGADDASQSDALVVAVAATTAAAAAASDATAPRAQPPSLRSVDGDGRPGAAAADAAEASNVTWAELSAKLAELAREARRTGTDTAGARRARARGRPLRALAVRALGAARGALGGAPATSSAPIASGSRNGVATVPAHPWYVLLPTSHAVAALRLLLHAVIAWDALVLPVQLCFFAEAQHLVWMQAMNEACDAVYWLQMIARALTAYVNDRSVLVVAPAEIRKHYLQSDFLLDAVAAWPMNYIALAFGAPRLDAWALRLFRLISARYALATYRSWERTRADVSLRVGIVQYLLIYLAVVHVCACLWNLLAYSPASPEPIERQWAWQWAQSIDAVGGSPYRARLLLQSWEMRLLVKYADSAFFNMAMLMTFSSGIGPLDFAELGFSIFVLLLNVTLYAWAVSQISALVMKQDDEVVAKRGQLQLVRAYLSHIRVSKELEAEISALFRQRLKDATLSAVRPEEIRAALPVSLQIEISRVTQRSRVEGLGLLRGCSGGFIDRLASLIHERIVEAETTLFRTSESSVELIVVESGAVHIFDDPMEEGGEPVLTDTLLSGDVAGEVAFVFGLRHVASARSSPDGETRLLTLGQDDYRMLVKMFPDQEDVLMDNAMGQHDGLLSARSGKSGRSAKSGKSGRSGRSALSSKTGISGLTGGALSVAASQAASLYAALHTVEKVISAARSKRNNALATRLCSACARGDRSGATRLLASSSIDVNRGDYDKRTPLHIAAGRGHLELARLLVAHNADVSARDRAGRTPLLEAVRGEHGATVSFLEAQGAQLSVPNLIGSLCAAASDAGALDELRYLVKGSDGQLATLADGNGRTPLHVAASAGHAEHVALLIEARADVNAVDAYGGTPLHDAFRNGHACSRLLLDHGAQLGEQFDAARALCEAAAADDVKTVGRLLAHKCDVNVADFDGRTALHIAAAHHRLATCTFLLSRDGIRVNNEDRRGDTALDDAQRTTSDVQEVVASLVQAFGGRAGKHMLRASVERSLAEQHKAVTDLARVEEMRLLLLKARRATGWLKAEALSASKLLKETSAAITAEEDQGAILADTRPHFLRRLSEYAQGHYERTAYHSGTLVPLLRKWQEQRDQYGQLKQELVRRLAQLAEQCEGVQPSMISLMETTFREPEDAAALVERDAMLSRASGSDGEGE